jgi:HTH-type transcriptional regulator/antitoxin MqsA
MNTKNFICPICDEGQLVPNVCMENTIYKEKTLTVNYDSSTCSICGSEIVTPMQAQRNQAHIIDEQKKMDGLLTSIEIKGIRETFNLTSTQAAKLFGSDATAFYKYEKGEATQSVTLDKLLRLVKEMPLAFERLRLISEL